MWQCFHEEKFMEKHFVAIPPRISRRVCSYFSSILTRAQKTHHFFIEYDLALAEFCSGAPSAHLGRAKVNFKKSENSVGSG